MNDVIKIETAKHRMEMRKLDNEGVWIWNAGNAMSLDNETARALYDALGEALGIGDTNKALVEALEALVDACDGNYQELVEQAKQALNKAKTVNTGNVTL